MGDTRKEMSLSRGMRSNHPALAVMQSERRAVRLLLPTALVGQIEADAVRLNLSVTAVVTLVLSAYYLEHPDGLRVS